MKNIIQLEGDKVIQEFNKSNHINGLPDFMIAYHPQCPHCKTIVNLVKAFADKVQALQLKINLIAVNLSKVSWK